jgi:hypothetical protein
MYNVGIDATFLNGKFGVTAEWYHKTTSDMLLAATYSALAGESSKPYINFGDMRNTGVDVTLNYHDSHGELAWDASLNLSHYRNEVIRLSEADDYAIEMHGVRLDGPVTRTTKGRPIAEFFGYKQDGFYETPEDVLNCKPIGQDITTLEEAEKWVGRFRFADIDKDGKLDQKDRVTLGSAHPDLIAGLNAGLSYKGWDFTMFWYSTIGNELFNNVRAFTDFNLFSGERSTRTLTHSWTPGADNSEALLPRINSADGYSGTVPSSYFVEDASFLRLKNLVVGYTFPKRLLKKVDIRNIRVYVQAENILTFTPYTGLDPEFTNADVSKEIDDDGNGTDLKKGIDMGGWPTTIRILAGINFSF